MKTGLSHTSHRNIFHIWDSLTVCKGVHYTVFLPAKVFSRLTVFPSCKGVHQAVVQTEKVLIRLTASLPEKVLIRLTAFLPAKVLIRLTAFLPANMFSYLQTDRFPICKGDHQTVFRPAKVFLRLTVFLPAKPAEAKWCALATARQRWCG